MDNQRENSKTSDEINFQDFNGLDGFIQGNIYAYQKSAIDLDCLIFNKVPTVAAAKIMRQQESEKGEQ